MISVDELVLSLLLALLALLLSLPNLRLLYHIFNSNQQPNVFDRGLALCLVTSGRKSISVKKNAQLNPMQTSLPIRAAVPCGSNLKLLDNSAAG